MSYRGVRAHDQLNGRDRYGGHSSDDWQALFDRLHRRRSVERTFPHSRPRRFHIGVSANSPGFGACFSVSTLSCRSAGLGHAVALAFARDSALGTPHRLTHQCRSVLYRIECKARLPTDDDASQRSLRYSASCPQESVKTSRMTYYRISCSSLHSRT